MTHFYHTGNERIKGVTVSNGVTTSWRWRKEGSIKILAVSLLSVLEKEEKGFRQPRRQEETPRKLWGF